MFVPVFNVLFEPLWLATFIVFCVCFILSFVACSFINKFLSIQCAIKPPIGKQHNTINGKQGCFFIVIYTTKANASGNKQFIIFL